MCSARSFGNGKRSDHRSCSSGFRCCTKRCRSSDTPAIRTRGTIGGTVAHADASAEIPCVVAALDGEMLVRSVRGERTIGASDFFQGHFTTALDDDECLVSGAPADSRSQSGLRVPRGRPSPRRLRARGRRGDALARRRRADRRQPDRAHGRRRRAVPSTRRRGRAASAQTASAENLRRRIADCHRRPAARDRRARLGGIPHPHRGGHRAASADHCIRPARGEDHEGGSTA